MYVCPLKSKIVSKFFNFSAKSLIQPPDLHSHQRCDFVLVEVNSAITNKAEVNAHSRTMTSSSKDMYVPVFSGHNFDHWAVKMRTVLVSEDLWEYVEEGYETPDLTMFLTPQQKQELREKRRNDGKALSIIQRGLSSSYFPKILNARSAKEAWDILHREFQFEGAPRTKLMLSWPDVTPVMEEGTTSLLGVPFNSLVLTEDHVKPPYHMSFPPSFAYALPSTIVPAIIKCFGKTWEVKFRGDRLAKGFDGSWRKFVEDSNLVAGDALVFEVLESNHEKVTFKVQILRCGIPPELQELLNKRSSNSEVIIMDDD